MENTIKFEKVSFKRQLCSMLQVDFKRMFKSKHFYILIVCALLLPVLMTVMMTMMDGSVSVNPQTGIETVNEGPENAWQNIGTLPGGENMGGMDVFGMCNINMVFMGIAVFVCLFVSDDFKSGYAKNLFTVRAKRGTYVISKIFSGFICGGLMLFAYFIGTILGGAISGLSFDLYGLTSMNLVMCMFSKLFIMPVFVSIFTFISIAAKQKTWLALCGSLGGGMLLFMMVSMVTPLNSTIVNVILCFLGGLMFAFGLGTAGNQVLKRTSLV